MATGRLAGSMRGADPVGNVSGVQSATCGGHVTLRDAVGMVAVQLVISQIHGVIEALELF